MRENIQVVGVEVEGDSVKVRKKIAITGGSFQIPETLHFDRIYPGASEGQIRDKVGPGWVPVVQALLEMI